MSDKYRDALEKIRADFKHVSVTIPNCECPSCVAEKALSQAPAQVEEGKGWQLEQANLIQTIKKLQEEIAVLHMSDSTIKAINQLSEIASMRPVSHDMQSMAQSLSAQLMECEKSRELFYLRKRIHELEYELRRLLSGDKADQPERDYKEMWEKLRWWLSLPFLNNPQRERHFEQVAIKMTELEVVDKAQADKAPGGEREYHVGDFGG